MNTERRISKAPGRIKFTLKLELVKILILHYSSFGVPCSVLYSSLLLFSNHLSPFHLHLNGDNPCIIIPLKSNNMTAGICKPVLHILYRK